MIHISTYEPGEEIEFFPVAPKSRIDTFLSRETDLSRSRIQQLISEGYILIADRAVNKNTVLREDDRIFLTVPPNEEIEAKPQDIPLNVVFEDEDIIVVDKPQGMVVHPAPGNPDNTLVNALLWHCKDSLSGINGKLRPGIVHRIDKDTSGLIIAAKTDRAHLALAEMFKTHSFIRKYQAILYGCPKNESGTVISGIGRSTADRKKMSVFPLNAPNTKNAVSHYKVLEKFSGYSLVEFTLETGRTHQIRVHSLYLGTPVLADPVYAPKRKNFGLSGQCLHAKYISFDHPVTGDKLEFDSPLPKYFLKVLSELRSLPDE